MKSVKYFAKVMFGIAAIAVSAGLLGASMFMPALELTGDVLLFTAVMLTVSSALTVATFAPRLSKLATFKSKFGQSAFERVLAEFVSYCRARKDTSGYISRLIMFIFTVLIVAALVCKGSVAIAVLLAVATSVSYAINAFIRGVASGKIDSESIAKSVF